ncbi:MAG: PhoH family protein [Candidatus Desantisbacteria bacterium]
MYEQTIILANAEEALGLFGQQDVNLRLIRDEFKDITLIPRGTELIIHGEHLRVDTVKKLLDDLISILHSGHVVRIPEIKYALKMISQNQEVNLPALFKEVICVSERGRIIKPKTMGQKRYIESIKTNDIVFGIGPAGTGKTYLAVAMAISELIRKQVIRIILTRPAIEAGERLGFLPGDLQEKIDPYLRPLYDALYDMMGIERVQHLLSEGIIEVAPLAFMRGRTLNDAFIILDEAQNTSSEQMKMFLTRLGFDSKTIITGDVTQIDLPKNATSGLVEVQSVIKNIPGIEFVYFNEHDVVRHELVSEVIKAYEAYKKKEQ